MTKDFAMEISVQKGNIPLSSQVVLTSVHEQNQLKKLSRKGVAWTRIRLLYFSKTIIGGFVWCVSTAPHDQ